MAMARNLEKTGRNYTLNKLLEEDAANAMIMSNVYELEMTRIESRLKEQMSSFQAHVLNDMRVLKGKWEDAVKAQESTKALLAKSEQEKQRLEAQIKKLQLENAELKKISDHQNKRLLLSEKAIKSKDAEDRKKYWLSRFSPDDVKKVIKCQKLIRKWLARIRFKKLVLELYRTPDSKQSAEIKPLFHRMRIIREILSTEKTYVTNLKTVVEHFLKPLRECVSNKLVNISPTDVQVIFSDLETIMNFNATLYATLSERKKYIAGTIGTIFLQMAPYLKMYTSYVNNYCTALSTLGSCQQSSKSFANWIKERESAPQLGNLHLSDFLINPIQRVPRYVMLFQDLLKHTSSDHKDYKNLEKLITELQNVASLINERKRQAEQMEKVLTVQAKLVGDFASLVKPHRRYIREGPLSKGKVHSTIGEERYYYLLSDVLLCTKQVGKMMEVEELKPLNGAVVQSSVPHNIYGFSFALLSDGEITYLGAPNPADATSWVADLEAAITAAGESFHDDEDLRKGLFGSGSTNKFGTVSGRASVHLGSQIINMFGGGRKDSIGGGAKSPVAQQKIIKQGKVKMLRNKSWKSKWMVLHDNDVTYHKNEEDTTCAGRMNLGELRTHKDLNKDTEFSLEEDNSKWVIQCESKADAEAWQAAIKKAKLTFWKDSKGSMTKALQQ
eukprot:TRINITY_DN8286_c0_g1_i1.p1 TRINITY_DN8286_c0_g1~~TRINITY_DN8286_c0_g1_i1.p1  ORF type:complete len:670 (+),score=210.29 TRINITY_DN8286_c0_g1_i1:111-2120(+)